MAVFVANERRARNPLVPFSIFRIKGLAAANLNRSRDRHPLLPRIGTRPVIVVGALVAAGGIYYLSRTPVDGAFLSDLLRGIVVLAIGAGAVFTGTNTVL